MKLCRYVVMSLCRYVVMSLCRNVVIALATEQGVFTTNYAY